MKTTYTTKLQLAMATGIAILSLMMGACTDKKVQTSPYAELKTASINTQQTIDMAQMQQAGKVVVVNFWATTCVTCKKEMPTMVQMYQKYHPKGLEYVAVAMQYDEPDVVKKYTQANQLPFLSIWDQNGQWANAFGGIIGTPTTYIVDKQGKVKKYIGEPDWPQFYADIEKALAS